MLSLEFWWIIHAWNDGIDEKEFFSSEDIEIDGLDFAFLRGSQTQWDINCTNSLVNPTFISKECFWSKKFLNFMHRFKSAILAIFHFCQNGTFKPVHEFQNFFWLKLFFWSIMKMAIRNFFCIMTQGLPNPGFMQEKVQEGDFLKKPSRKLKNIFCFRFEWLPWRPGTLN